MAFKARSTARCAVSWVIMTMATGAPGARPRWIMLSMETPASRQLAGDVGQDAGHIQHFEAQIPGRDGLLAVGRLQRLQAARRAGRRPGWRRRARPRQYRRSRRWRWAPRPRRGRRRRRSPPRPHPPARHWRRRRHWPAASAPAPWRDGLSGRSCRRRAPRHAQQLDAEAELGGKGDVVGGDMRDAFHRHAGKIGRGAEGQAARAAPACARCRRRRHPAWDRLRHSPWPAPPSAPRRRRGPSASISVRM